MGPIGSMKPLIIANWKSNPATVAEAVSLAREVELKISKYRNIEVVIAPPFPYLISIKKALKSVKLGAQNSFWDGGPYTGEVSPRQLKDLGVRYVIVGHSERKIYLGESDEMINKKVKSLLDNGLSPVLCVGESEKTDDALHILGEQIQKALLGVKKNRLKNLVVAYEPAWAISTAPDSRPDSPDSAFKATIFIKRKIGDIFGRERAAAVRIIYGGSVNSKNISPFLYEGKMEGALVGGASLDPREFSALIKNSTR